MPLPFLTAHCHSVRLEPDFLFDGSASSDLYCSFALRFWLFVFALYWVRTFGLIDSP